MKGRHIKIINMHIQSISFHRAMTNKHVSSRPFGEEAKASFASTVCAV